MFLKAPVSRQMYSTACANLMAASAGATTGWGAVNYVDLQRDDSTFPTGPLSLRQASIVIQAFFVSCILGNLLIPYMVEKCGSKRTMFIMGLPQIMSWLLIIFAQNPYYLYASRLLAGFAISGVFISAPVFVTDICHDEIRGTLNAIFDPFMNLGTLLAFLLAKYFNYVHQSMFLMTLAIGFVILFAGIPDTPQHLKKVQKLEAANKANQFFKGKEMEISKEDDKKLSDSRVTLSDFTNPRARKAIIIAFSLSILNALQGYIILLTYITDIFQKSNPNMSSIDASIIISVVLLLANIIYMYSTDRAGRRTFFIYSSLATTVGLALFALYLIFLMDDRAFDWAPIAIMSYVLFVSCLGMNPVSYLIMIEIFPRKIKHYGYACCMVLILGIVFVLSEFYPQIQGQIGVIGLITFFATASFCNALYGIFALPETKGKSHEEIMKILDSMNNNTQNTLV